MSAFVRPLCVLLAALIALAGGTIDLCACDGEIHGALCAEAESPAVESCCGSPAPPVEIAPTVESCCGSEAPPASAPEIGAAGCGCPVVQLDVSPAEADRSTLVVSTGNDLVRSLALDLPTDEVLVVSNGEASSARSPPPEPGGIRRHLLLRVLRC